MKKSINTHCFAVVTALLLLIAPLAAMAQGADGTTYAVLVGISQYSDHTLPRTDEDARRIGRALEQQVAAGQLDQQLILNSEATRANVLAALSRVAARSTAGDTVIFFYSGHGNQVPMSRWTADEPDALQETLSLYDGQLLDDELSTALDRISSRLTLVALDSCFSGGFLYDVVNRPGRMGLFSSDEDLTSGVPQDAGGYLSKYLAEALEGEADGSANQAAGQSRDGVLTALEIEAFVRDRWVELARSPASARDHNGVGFQFVDIKRTDVRPTTKVIDMAGGPAAVEERVMASFQGVELAGSSNFLELPVTRDFQLEAGHTYVFETSGLSGDCDTMLELRSSVNPNVANESDRVVATNDDVRPGNLASRIEFTPTQSGAYYAHILPYAEGTGGHFDLRIFELVVQ